MTRIEAPSSIACARSDDALLVADVAASGRTPGNDEEAVLPLPARRRDFRARADDAVEPGFLRKSGKSLDLLAGEPLTPIASRSPPSRLVRTVTADHLGRRRRRRLGRRHHRRPPAAWTVSIAGCRSARAPATALATVFGNVVQLEVEEDR